MDKKYLAGTADLLFIFVVLFAGVIYASVYGNSIFKIGGSAIVVATAITVYYFHIGSKIYVKLGWLEA